MSDVKGRAAAGLVIAAVVYSCAFVALAAAQLPAAGVVLAAQPLLISLVMWKLLKARCTTGDRASTVASRVIAFLYLPWSVLAAVTLAIGALPAAMLLAVAAVLTPAPPRAA